MNIVSLPTKFWSTLKHLQVNLRQFKFQVLWLRMTHFYWRVVWSLMSMSSQVDDVDLLRQAGGAPACTPWQDSEALQHGLHWVSRPHWQQLTWAAKQRSCSRETTILAIKINIKACVWFIASYIAVNLNPSNILEGLKGKLTHEWQKLQSLKWPLEQAIPHRLKILFIAYYKSILPLYI